MGKSNNTENEISETIQLNGVKAYTNKENEIVEAFAELERGVYAALETYSNVHRGSGHKSMVSTHLFEQARNIVMEYLGLNKNKYVIIFCTPRRASILISQIKQDCYKILSSQDIGLSIGISALAVKKNSLPGGVPFQTGGGTARLISGKWVIWADAQDKFEAGTPAIINIIAFAKALKIMQLLGNDIFKSSIAKKMSVTEILYHDELEKYAGQELLDELRKTQIGRNMLVPTMEGTLPFVNLDNSASTPTFTPIWNTFCQTWSQSEQVKQEIIQEVKSICAKALNAPIDTYDVIFTSNTTEAINLAAESIFQETEIDYEPVIANTLLEHSSNELPWRMIPNSSLIRLSVNEEGFIDLNELDGLLNNYNKKAQYGKKRIKIVAISGASNVLGVCNNIVEISKIVHQYGAQLLVDAAQLVAHRKIDVEKCGIDYLAFSAHKMYAPFGCGVLIARKGLLNFNTSEMKVIKSSGEENASGIAALGKAFLLMQRIGMDLIQEEEMSLTWRAIHGLAQIPGLTIYGIKDAESSSFSNKIGVIPFTLKGMMSNRVAKELAVRGGIGIRYGCHCAHIIVKHILHVSPFLEGFQRVMQTLLPGAKFPGVARVSLGLENSEEDIKRLIYVLGKISKQSNVIEQNNPTSIHERTPILPEREVEKQMKDFVKASFLKVYSQ